MFGTVGRAHLDPENQQKLIDVFREQSYQQVPGFVRSYVMFPQNPPGEVLIVAMFENEEAYRKNADDPAQHERYLQYRALLKDDPEWADGEWLEA
jgi:hypothetical protein